MAEKALVRLAAAETEAETETEKERGVWRGTFRYSAYLLL